MEKYGFKKNRIHRLQLLFLLLVFFCSLTGYSEVESKYPFRGFQIPANLEIIHEVIQFDQATDPNEKWIKSENVSHQFVPDGNGGRALKIEMEFSKRLNGFSQVEISTSPEASGVNGIYFRYKGDLSNLGLTFWLSRGAVPEDNRVQNFGNAHPAPMDSNEWKEVFLPLEFFRFPDQHKTKINAMAFILTQTSKNPPPSGTLIIDDLRLVHEKDQKELLFKIDTDEEFFDKINTNYVGFEAVKSALQGDDIERAKLELVEYMRTRESPVFYMDYRDKEKILSTYRDIFGEKGLTDAEFRKNSERVMQNIFKMAEYEASFPDGNVDWSPEGSGQTWTWSAVIQRMAMLKDLGVTYWITKDEKYATKAIDLFEDFNRDWPIKKFDRIIWNFSGWNHGIGVSERVHNWIQAYHFFMTSDSFTVDQQINFFNRLIEHGQWLYVDTLHGPYLSNSQIVEAAALADVAVWMPFLKDSDQWKDLAYHRLNYYNQEMVLADGAFEELTPGYHLWMAFRFSIIYRLAALNNIPLTKQFKERTEKMYEWVGMFSRPDRHLPAIGDGGESSLRSQLSLAAAIYQRADFKFIAEESQIQENHFWYLGAESIEQYSHLTPQAPDATLQVLKPSQFISIRSDWSPNANYLFFNTSADGGTGHPHPDSLAVDVAVFGKPILSDPGMKGYSHPNHFNFFRKSRAHSILMINNQELPNVLPQLVKAESLEHADYCVGSLKYPNHNIRHTRHIWFLRDPGFWMIMDEVEGDGRNLLEQIWRMAKNIDLSIFHEENRTVAKIKEGPGLIIQNLNFSTADILEEDQLADFEGKPPVTIHKFYSTLPVKIKTVLWPLKKTDKHNSVRFELIPGAETNSEILRVHVSGSSFDYHWETYFKNK